MRIEVGGGIASGKTTLTYQLSNYFNSSFESWENNPFREAFYEDPSKFAFETEISFLLQHYHDIKRRVYFDKPKDDDSIWVFDSSLLLDLSYAEVGLSGNKMEVFRDIFDAVIDDIFLPDILIVLECPAGIQFNRIKERGREVEQDVKVDFLDNLNQTLYNTIDNYESELEILRVDSHQTDFLKNKKAADDIASEVSIRLKG